MDMLKRMCEDDEEALRLLREVVTDDHGGDRRSEEAQTKNDNIILGSEQGSSKDYTLDRLASCEQSGAPLPEGVEDAAFRARW